MMDMFSELATRDDIGRLEERFDQMDARFEKIDDRFDKIDARFEKIDDRFVKIHERLDRSSEQFVGFYKNMLVTVVASMTALTGIFAGLLTVVR